MTADPLGLEAIAEELMAVLRRHGWLDVELDRLSPVAKRIWARHPASDQMIRLIVKLS